jgi:hypothetical protein
VSQFQGRLGIQKKKDYSGGIGIKNTTSIYNYVGPKDKVVNLSVKSIICNG